jgi:NADPH-dependent 2,4-dienoyl-CoA reductase/sulfur reductase-like enzyme
MARRRAVVVGGDAAGATAASRVRATDPDAEVVMLERGRYTSYSACGIPYVVGGGVVGGLEALIVRDPAEHRRRGIDVRIDHDVVAVDPARGEIEFLDRHAGVTGRLGYDELLIATGGAPIRPELPGIDLPFVQGLQTLGDAERLLGLAEQGCRRTVIVGGGYIGLEIAEAFIERGCGATVIERNPQPLSLLDEDLGAQVAAAMRARGVDLWTDTEVRAFEPGRVLTSADSVDADLVVLGIGVAPRVELAERAGIELGPTGAIRVDDRQATTTPGVWSAGDCAESRHIVTGHPVHIPLGTYANKHGRVAGINMAGGRARSRPVAGTAITRLCSLEVALTGLRRQDAVAAGIAAIAVTVESTTSAGYMPTAQPMTVRLAAERGTGRLLGAQIVGGPGAAKRIDTVATALAAGMTVADVAELDLAYAPPYSSVWDPVAVAARAALDEV